ncbi:MAG: ABC transporter permease [Spirochaetaceae bacterium]|nr:ABC transporter permease [Spirochaetaceae bacterium]
MEVVIDLFRIGAPLLITAVGALISEFAGIMAVFADGFINLGSFLCYTVTFFSGSPVLGVFISVIICVLLGWSGALATKILKANPFLIGLAINLSVKGLISLLSVSFFGTRGVLSTSEDIISYEFYIGLVICSWVMAIFIAILLGITKYGLQIKITGTAPEALFFRGIKVSLWENLSWCIAAAFSCFAGCILTAHLSSFVPNISAGKGWLALAAVFLAKKNIFSLFIAVMVFVSAEFLFSGIQNISIFQNISPSVTLAFPYIITLILICFDIKKKT